MDTTIWLYEGLVKRLRPTTRGGGRDTILGRERGAPRLGQSLSRWAVARPAQATADRGGAAAGEGEEWCRSPRHPWLLRGGPDFGHGQKGGDPDRWGQPPPDAVGRRGGGEGGGVGEGGVVGRGGGGGGSAGRPLSTKIEPSGRADTLYHPDRASRPAGREGSSGGSVTRGPRETGRRRSVRCPGSDGRRPMHGHRGTDPSRRRSRRGCGPGCAHRGVA